MRRIEEYMQDMNLELQRVHLYRNLRFDPRSHDCTQIARLIATMFVEDGKSPDVIRVGKQDMSDKLKPVMYPNMTPWSFHDVCRLDRVVYDPNLGKPCPMDNYMQLLFNKRFRFSYNEELNQEIQSLIRRRGSFGLVKRFR